MDFSELLNMDMNGTGVFVCAEEISFWVLR